MILAGKLSYRQTKDRNNLDRGLISLISLFAHFYLAKAVDQKAPSQKNAERGDLVRIVRLIRNFFPNLLQTQLYHHTSLVSRGK
jgi:hypothetical protein